MQKITPFIWFNNNGEEAINFYASIFKNSKFEILGRYPADPANPDKPRLMLSATFELEGQKFLALNGGPMFQLNEAFSLFVNCETQEEVDEYWNKLSEGGKKSQCGWLKDKYGLWWQIIPSLLNKLMYDKNPKKSKAVMDAMMKMGKIESKVLQDAYDNA